MKKKVLTVLFILMLAAFLVSPAVAEETYGKKPPANLTNEFKQEVPINLVFIGYEDDQIDLGAIQGILPAAYTPLARIPKFYYGLNSRDIGLEFTFDYSFRFTDAKFEKKFFKFLETHGTPGDPTLFQQYYNDSQKNVLDVTGPVLYIDAPTVEKYLMDHTMKMLGKKGERGYTVYFVNWFGQKNFKFHVYTKTDESDPDTGYNFGAIRPSRKMIAWGGTYGRSWFYDLSAGPEAWTNNWAVDFPDLDGDGVVEYRMPPIWEYTAGGYRDPSQLSYDLGLITRFVAINLLFTTSPLYDPLVTAPGAGGSKVAHIEMFEDDPASNGLDWINTGFAYDKWNSFEPYYNWSVNLEDNNPIDPAAQRAFRIAVGLLAEDDCWNAYGTPFAEFFCYFDSNLGTYVPPYDPEDYVGEIFAFNTTAANLGNLNGVLGFSDDNWVDGTQSYVFEFDTDDYRSLGYGFTTTTIHEFGHHIGLSHPHDGYDSEFGWDYRPGGFFYFAWSGDESDTIMHYMDLSTEFGQFDQDNMYRFETAGYVGWALDLVEAITAHPNATAVKPYLTKAMVFTKKATRSFHNWDYLQAATFARRSYENAATAAEILGIPLSAVTMQSLAAPNLDVPHEGDPIRFPDN